MGGCLPGSALEFGSSIRATASRWSSVRFSMVEVLVWNPLVKSALLCRSPPAAEAECHLLV